MGSEHVYETFVRATPAQIWKALTDGELSQKFYFGDRVESDWKIGSVVTYWGATGNKDSEGVVLEIEPNSLLKTTMVPAWLPLPPGTEPSKTAWTIQPISDTVTQVAINHSDVADDVFEQGQFHMGWLYVLASLKSLLETGDGLPDIFAQQ